MHSYECKLKETPWTWSIIYIIVSAAATASTFRSSIALIFSAQKGRAEWFLHLSDMAKTLNTCSQCALGSLACCSHEWYMKRKTRFFYNEIHFKWIDDDEKRVLLYELRAIYWKIYFQLFFKVRHGEWEKHTQKLF